MAKQEYTCSEIAWFAEKLAPLVKKVDKSYVKGGFKRPKLQQFCEEYKLPCEFIGTSKGKKKYYSVRTWDE